MTEPRPEPDTMTRDGAEALARKLDAYWHAQGFPQVQHWVERQGRITLESPHRGESIWVVRSNLVRGQPPRSTA